MSSRCTLLQPFWFSIRNRFFIRHGNRTRSIAMLLTALLAAALLHAIAFKVVRYFHSQNELGIILSLKIFQMAWIILFAMVIFSCMVSAVSTLFLSRDNEIVAAAPVPLSSLYAMRYVTTSVYTAWMMVFFALPIFIAYGQVFSAGPLYWPLMPLMLVATTAAATALGMLATILLVNIFPARRTKDIVLYLSLCFGILIYILFRLLRPEELVNPDQYAHFIEYLAALSTPAAPYLPAAWAANLLSLYLLDREIDWLLTALLLVTPLALYILGEGAMERWFFRGYSKSQESFGGFRRFGARIANYRPNPSRWIFSKEIKSFLRDSTEWSQLFMIGALVIVYLYNFKILPLERSYIREEYLANLIAFLNIGLTGFMMASLAARFVFPSLNAEGGAISLVQSSPLSMRRFLLHKYLCYAIPFSLLAMLLIVASNQLLAISGPIWWLSLAITMPLTWTVVALALSFGAIHADFKAENRAATLGSWGAILFLFTAMGYELIVIAGASYPTYRLVRLWLRHENLPAGDIFLLTAWAAMALLLSAVIVFHFFRRGVNALTNPGE